LIEMRGVLTLMCVCAAAAACAPAALAGGGAPDRPDTLRDRVEDLQQEVESLTEDIEDLGEPVEEFDLFDQCAYTIGVTQYGTWGGDTGFLFGSGGRTRRPALAMDMRGFGRARFQFLAFPGEEPPSIECNEDAGEEFIDN
jgi:hypothetical protein